MIDVVDIGLDPAGHCFKRCGFAPPAADLREAGDAGLHALAQGIAAQQLAIIRIMREGVRPRADERHVYAISNTTVAQYDRVTGRLVQAGTAADAKHLNSGFLHEGRVYCAHSNYPAEPPESEIRVFDPATGKLTLLHRFANPPGSLAWITSRFSKRM